MVATASTTSGISSNTRSTVASLIISCNTLTVFSSIFTDPCKSPIETLCLVRPTLDPDARGQLESHIWAKRLHPNGLAARNHAIRQLLHKIPETEDA
ncbi:hypothetical protein PsorP6_003680 [Peronosclerospora sorghi]|uniref:Uncharacterized protein n=1 Tax=Peronosclerospora sorghi TaxID=230839 RepID=A0ACC0VSG8_9STRA|nr:hypothetical protein PsorP6_003680 [Peronosclerospora sorghi]